MVNLVGLAIIAVLSMACMIAAIMRPNKPKDILVGVLGIFVFIPTIVFLILAMAVLMEVD